MKYILGTKEYMTLVFDEEGVARSATVVSAGPITVTQIKTKSIDGYDAVQVGFMAQSEKKTLKAQKGHCKGNGFKKYTEIRMPADKASAYKVGDVISTEIFASGDSVVVSGTSKGKGFQGVVKRHGFHGGRRSHGQKHSEREAGSIGGGGRAGGRVVKGMRMPGRMGNDTITVKGLTILAVIPEEHKLIVGGALPGRRGTVLSIASE
ncbi:MAG: 50S ribosomal protein L3 [Candidatus Paceibacterota bacterium]